MKLSEAKRTIRSRMRRMRRELPADERAVMDAALFRNITQSAWFEKADTLLLYASCGGEADTLAVLEYAFAHGRRLALPRCEADGQMRFWLAESMDSLQHGAYGILEPTGTVQAEITERTVCFVPGLAFTHQGERLGQGGGYYDRFMQNYPYVQRIGICYAFQVMDVLPSEAHDERMHAIITEKTVEVCDGI